MPKFSTRSPMGFIWWTADDIDEAIRWANELEQKGAKVLRISPDDDGSYRFIFAVNKEEAKSVLGYEPGDEEWLCLSPYQVTVQFFRVETVDGHPQRGSQYGQTSYRVAALQTADACILAKRDALEQSPCVSAEAAFEVSTKARALPDEDLYESICEVLSAT